MFFEFLKTKFFQKEEQRCLFPKSLQEHLNWGVTFVYDKNERPINAKAKIFTYPDLKKVEIEIVKDRGEDFLNDYKSDNLQIYKKAKIYELKCTEFGVYEANELKIRPKDRYRFKLTFKDDKTRYISDLYSYEQKGLLAWPVAYDNKAYERSYAVKHLFHVSKDWKNGIIRGRLNNLKSPEDIKFINSDELKLMQIHIGTFSIKGDFSSAAKKLDKIKDLGFNGVELLPHGYFHDTNWGYDPSFVFASQYGGNDEFKKFCDEAHKKGLNVIVDLVNNHYSMDCPEIITEAGLYEHPDSKMKIDFGPRINYTQEGKCGVRNWRINEALYWLQYADGIRFDLTDFTASFGFNTQLNIEIQEHFPECVTFAESPSKESSNPLPKEAIIENLPLDSTERTELHTEIIKKALDDKFGANRQGFTHRWHFDWSHAIEHSILHPSDRRLHYLKTQILDAQRQMKIMFSHDEIGKQEADGNDIIVKILIAKYFSEQIGDINWKSPREKYEKYWKASRAIRELLRIYLTDENWPDDEKQLKFEASKGEGYINDFNHLNYGIADYQKGGLGLAEVGFTRGISKRDFDKKFKAAFALNKALFGFLFTQPGPKMVFQSFNKPDRRFAFFRKNSEHFYETYKRSAKFKYGVDWETEIKGHRLDSDEIINQAKVDFLGGKYNKKALEYQHNMEKLVKTLNGLVDKNPCLTVGEIKDVVDSHKNVIAVHTQKDHNELYSITNFDESKGWEDYRMQFPKGFWKEIINTSQEEFGGEVPILNEMVTGGQECEIKLSGASTIIFKRIG